MMNDFQKLVDQAVSTAETAMAKYPQPNYVISKIAEESGEVVKAAIHYAENRDSAEHVRAEMIDAIAMLYRLWHEGDQVHGCPPIKGR
jgi:phosphoribosyl-ATP pyrophosphohydrolase